VTRTGVVLESTHNGRRVPNPTDAQIEAAVTALPRGSALVLHEAREDHYAQTRLRPEGVYQLEHRNGSADEHYQTRTVSAERVTAALTAWRHGDPTWTDAFTWQPWP
jgi:hypothetical protein